MYFDADVGAESISGTHTALGLERIAWTTLCVLAMRRHS